ncbi:MAG: hypothetical protein IJM20_03315, partial [Clostridia bacterium]|nr:hypothetical protein [Clostridia bacterium]
SLRFPSAADSSPSLLSGIDWFSPPLRGAFRFASFAPQKRISPGSRLADVISLRFHSAADSSPSLLSGIDWFSPPLRGAFRFASFAPQKRITPGSKLPDVIL